MELSAQTFYQTACEEQGEGLPKNSTSMSVLFAAQQLAGAALLLPCLEPPAPALGERGGTLFCFTREERHVVAR